MTYYDLPPDKRWLGDNNGPYAVGGRETDVSQIASSLYCRVRDAFPINEVPTEVARNLEKLSETLEQAETDIELFIELVSRYIKERS